MKRWASRLRRVPVLAWVTITVILAWIVAGSWWWASATEPEVATPTPSVTISPSATPATASACEAFAEVTNAWEGGFQVDVTVTSLRVAIDDWKVAFDLGSAVVDGSWNSALAVGASGPVTASSVEYNGRVPASSSTTFGFTARGTAPAELDAVCESSTAAPAGSTADGRGDPVPATPPGVYRSSSNVDSPNDDDWLHTDGNRIVDARGDAVWLTGANWFGFNTEERVFHGLWAANLGELLDAVASRGINVIRVPISTELLLEWKEGNAAVPPGVNQALNEELVGKTTLEVFDAFLGAAKDRGLKVILDVHSAKADNAGHIAPMWFAGDITAEDFYAGWEWVAERYSSDDTIIGFDLQNEPHGQPSEQPHAVWDGSTSANNWRHAAEVAASRIHAVHPDALILVEGIEATPKAGSQTSSTDNADYDFGWWGGNLRMAGTYPIRLDDPDKLVYSPHEYGPLVYEQPWFKGAFSAQSLRADVWEPNWLYLHDREVAPLLIGEWGGRFGQDARQDKWMTALRDLIVEERLAHTFWCINPNSSDTGGLLLDDWSSWDEQKYALLRPALWQDRDGAFVSLDHATPLPGGISVTQYYADGNAAPQG
ncbi:cellulase family glycosylhydrolase [Demequina sp. TTPB684]|uniref:cellulase family glycosylhydrolase n=1 Tax=unclassified Demequina TaxID=2620311 RepID=UPI001CF4676E|nr:MULTISPECIES: cellulase family glycosylhydrolase [unclassified Demequina]MCB2411817.1 cellulase family glycosylhydrolase [Demequina sp. TTPB684]UPU88830.1 cellulase family glycosylhydrolase [Demequina sp. TMPB413]